MFSGERIIIIQDNINPDTIYGYLKLVLDKNTNSYRIQDIQNRIYELKEEIGEEYTVNEIMEIIVNEFENIIEYNDNVEDNLEI